MAEVSRALQVRDHPRSAEITRDPPRSAEIRRDPPRVAGSRRESPGVAEIRRCGMAEVCQHGGAAPRERLHSRLISSNLVQSRRISSGAPRERLDARGSPSGDDGPSRGDRMHGRRRQHRGASPPRRRSCRHHPCLPTRASRVLLRLTRVSRALGGGGRGRGGASSQERHSWSAAATTQSAASSAGR